MQHLARIMSASQFAPLLAVQKPVPEDIVIAQSIEPVHITKIAEQLGLLPEEFDLYGVHKAKASARRR